jgi:hypothetical protein
MNNFRVAGVGAKIRTRNLPNKCQERYATSSRWCNVVWQQTTSVSEEPAVITFRVQKINTANVSNAYFWGGNQY